MGWAEGAEACTKGIEQRIKLRLITACILQGDQKTENHTSTYVHRSFVLISDSAIHLSTEARSLIFNPTLNGFGSSVKLVGN